MVPPPLISDACSNKYEAAHHSGVRYLENIRWIVLHSTEGETAEAAARWFANPDSSGSAHLVIDETHCFRTLKNFQIAWAAPGANTQGFHIELAGYAAWPAEAWKARDRMLRRAAYKTAFHSLLFKLPLQWVSAAGLVAGREGLTTHVACSKAFGGNHTDPGDGFPKTLFMSYAKEYAAQIGSL